MAALPGSGFIEACALASGSDKGERRNRLIASIEEWLAQELAPLRGIRNILPAARLLYELVTSPEPGEFLTLPGYRLLVDEKGSLFRGIG